MSTDDITITSYLNELYQQTEGDSDKQASMYEVGMAIGLDKSIAGSLAEELMVQGLVELKTLSGGIGITTEGLAFLGIAGTSTQANGGDHKLSEGPVVNSSDRSAIEAMTAKVKAVISGEQLEYALLEEIVLDLKTVEVQMLSPNPKTSILREIFRSLQNGFETAKRDDITAVLKVFCG